MEVPNLCCITCGKVFKFYKNKIFMLQKFEKRIIINCVKIKLYKIIVVRVVEFIFTYFLVI